MTYASLITLEIDIKCIALWDTVFSVGVSYFEYVCMILTFCSRSSES